MNLLHLSGLWASALLASGTVAFAGIQVTVDHNNNEQASAAFRFRNVPPPSRSDLGTRAQLLMVEGQRDENGGGLERLRDGRVPSREDEPEANFFFNAGTAGGRISVDLGSAQEIRQVNTYSWHTDTRGPQVYELYGSEGEGGNFNSGPRAGSDPAQCGWKLIASVDTRPKAGEGGGQYGVSIADPEGFLGKYRYLLFDIARTEENDPFGNTFYSEIDVVGKEGVSPLAAAAAAGESEARPFVTHSPDGYCTITINTAEAPELKDWAEQKLAPVLAKWYPKLVSMLASQSYEAPRSFSVTLRPGKGVAATGGTRITANSIWLKRELDGEAIGALVHEEVHVVQQYRFGRRRNPEARRTRPPGWVVEGIPDYIRWFKYEPQSHGADIVWLRSRRNINLRYDASYRVSANFLNYVVEKYCPDLITKLNAASRQGEYSADLWKTCTGKTIQELGDEWKTATEKQLAERATAPAPSIEANLNTLTPAEKAAGWKLLFNGKDFTGWHNFKREGVRPGWQVKDGALVCADPHNAGDLVTAGQFTWFELQLDYNISKGGNSGIMYHVTNEGGSAWATGPEFQLEDNKAAADRIRCGWLYALYQPPLDPATGKPLDATKPAGEWNHVRLLITPQKCEHEINGVEYFDYVLGSDDFNSRVAKSKFASMPRFAKSNSGRIALQGDHGQVSFRNIKIRPLQ